MLGFTTRVDVYVSVSDVMYFQTPAFDADTVQPNLQSFFSVRVLVFLASGSPVDTV